MTKTTNSRQLRLLMDGVLAKHGIDNLQLSIDLSECAKRFFADEGDPVKTRESILRDVQLNMEQGTARQVRLDEIRAEIENRVRISPNGREWEDFLKWAYNKEKKEGQIISRFIDWWVSDEWRLAHPPSSPHSWYVKWLQAFPTENAKEVSKEGGSGYYA